MLRNFVAGWLAEHFVNKDHQVQVCLSCAKIRAKWCTCPYMKYLPNDSFQGRPQSAMHGGEVTEDAEDLKIEDRREISGKLTVKK